MGTHRLRHDVFFIPLIAVLPTIYAKNACLSSAAIGAILVWFFPIDQLWQGLIRKIM